MFGFSWDMQEATGFPSSPLFAFANAEAAALVARMDVQPPRARKLAIDVLVGALKAAGIWSRLDALYVFAVHHAQAARLNWIGPALSLTVEGNVSFQADRGYTTHGLDGALSLGVGATALTYFTQNAATMAVWVRGHTINQSTATLGNALGSGAMIHMTPRNGSGAIAVRINSANAVAGGTVSTGWGLTAATRSSSTAVQCYKNGAASGTAGSASSSVRSSSIVKIGSSGGSFAEQQFQCALFGDALTAQEHANLHAALNAYMAAAGVVELVPATPVWASEAVATLPDGVAPLTAGKGLNALGMTRDPTDGTWWIARGTGNASLTLAGVAHMTTDFSTLLSDWTLTDLNNSDSGNMIADLLAGSCQGIAFDSSDNTLYMVNKATSAGAQLVRFSRSGQLLAVSLLPSSSSNGLAYDAIRDKLIVGISGGNIIWCNKDGTIASGTAAKQIRLASTEYGDQIWHDSVNDWIYMSRDAATGVDCSCQIWKLADTDCPIPYRAMVAQLSSSRAIEGAVSFDGKLYTSCDGTFHSNDIRSDNHWRRHNMM